jgi:hypothetical protein
MGRGRGTAPFPGTPSLKTDLGRLHKTLDTPDWFDDTKFVCRVNQCALTGPSSGVTLSHMTGILIIVLIVVALWLGSRLMKNINKP